MGVTQLYPRNLFKELLWHPGKMDQSFNDCVIHAINMFVGGPLFMSREQWCRLYAARRRMSYNDIWEDVRLYGVNLRYLRFVIYDLGDETWYKIGLKGQIDRNLIVTYVME
jgi:hypothetical protein